MMLARAREELARSGTRADPDGTRRRAAVLTMGALHEGHLRLVEQARREVGSAGQVLLSIFVNPTQFGPGEDLGRYPRAMPADLAAAEAAGVDVVFAPSSSMVYPLGDPDVTVDPGPLGDELEGLVRPGHFRGVLTVVCKLLRMTDAQVTVFGEKDYQQLVLVRRMCLDLDLGVEVVAVPTEREPDGLARSSRNRYLDDLERTRAVAMPRALRAGAAAGGRGAESVCRRAREELEMAGLVPDYVEVRSPELGPAPQHGPARLLVAARAGTTRLLDNAPVHLGEPRPGAGGQP